jgi:hypothetical protein
MLVSKMKIVNGQVKTKDATSLHEEYAEKLFNKLYMDLTASQKEEVKRHMEYDLNTPPKAKDSKTKDEKIISITTPQWEGDIKIVDGTHFEMKAKGTDRWSWALHIGQADDHILNALKAKGVLKDNGRFFATDSKTTDDDKNKDPFIQRQIEIAKKTLKMPGAMVGVMGGMTKAEAKEILKKYGVSEDTYEATKPKNIAAAKSLSVAQGKAASDAKTKDVGVKYVGTYKGIKIDKTNEGRFLAYINYDPVLKNSLQEMKDYIDKKATGDKRHLVRAKDEDKVGDWENRVLGTMKKIYELQGEEDLYTLCNKAISQIRVPEVFRNEIYTDITGHWNASKNFILGR